MGTRLDMAQYYKASKDTYIYSHFFRVCIEAVWATQLSSVSKELVSYVADVGKILEHIAKVRTMYGREERGFAARL